MPRAKTKRPPAPKPDPVLPISPEDLAAEGWEECRGHLAFFHPDVETYLVEVIPTGVEVWALDINYPEGLVGPLWTVDDLATLRAVVGLKPGPGRPKGSTTVGQVAAALVTKCQCGSTLRTPYNNTQAIPSRGTDPGFGAFTHVVFRSTKCRACGLPRRDRHLENRVR